MARWHLVSLQIAQLGSFGKCVNMLCLLLGAHCLLRGADRERVLFLVICCNSDLICGNVSSKSVVSLSVLSCCSENERVVSLLSLSVFFLGDFDRFRELDRVDVAMTGWSVVGRVVGSMGACLGVMSVCATVANIGTLR